MSGKLRNRNNDKSSVKQNDDLHCLRDSIKTHPHLSRSIAKKAIEELKLTDKQKVESGLFEWIIVTPKYGTPYRALRKKSCYVKIQ